MIEPSGTRPAAPEPPAALRALFPQPIRSAAYLDPGYSGHASDVWLVTTDSEEAVVRSHRGEGGSDGLPDGAFFWGCHRLCGIDPRRVFDLQPLHALLRACGGPPVPRVLRMAEVGGRQWVVLQRMPGAPITSLVGAPDTLLADLGGTLARVHRVTHDCCGAPAGGPTYPLAAFPARLADTLRAVAARFRPDDVAVRRWLAHLLPSWRAEEPPGAASLVMMDLDGGQFLAQGGRLTAVVDTEAYVLAPRELDFTALECLLDPRGAAVFAAAYAAVHPLPRLGPVRLPYRLLLFLLEVQGEDDCDRWMRHPVRFP